MQPTKVQWYTTYRENNIGVLKSAILKGFMIAVVRGGDGCRPEAIINPAEGGSLVTVDIDRVHVVES